MGTKAYDVVICGAGIAGIAAAFYLSGQGEFKKIALVDERQPLTLTSDKSTECYRNWWPGPGDAMVRLMNHSINLMENLARESRNIFHMNRRGYLYMTADLAHLQSFEQAARESSALGSGPLRVHRGMAADPEYQPNLDWEPDQDNSDLDGADLILDAGKIRRWFPYLAPDVQAVLHVRRAGWLSAQQLGITMLNQSRRQGVELIRARVSDIRMQGRATAILRLEDHELTELSAGALVLAGGPKLPDLTRMLGIDLPLFSELHLKVAVNDPLEVVPRYAPLLIWNDPMRLPFTEDERQELAEDPETRWLLDELPAGLHTRPEGGEGSQTILILWPYHTPAIEPSWPIPEDPFYPEVLVRGLARMLPRMCTYLGRLPRPTVDGGYYTKTRENRPLIGPLEVEGAYVIGALSGFGIMAACGSGDLLARHVSGRPLPDYAPSFTLDRYQDPGYLAILEAQQTSGQL
jgi:glycine/D-amino acid oxidase-like deaminating enzyme